MGAQNSWVDSVHGWGVLMGAQVCDALCVCSMLKYAVFVSCIDPLVGPLGEEVRLITTAVDGCHGCCG